MKSFVKLAIFLIIALSGCNDSYRYYCQDPDHFGAPQCQKPRCEFTQDCPEYLVAPILEKKIEGNPATPANTQPQPGTTNCR